MSDRKLIVIVLCALMPFGIAAAQTSTSVEKTKDILIGGSLKSSTEKIMMPKSDPSTGIPSDYKNFTDDKLEEMERRAKDREWNSEDTAWKRACEIDTKQAYQRYSAMYPNGAHIADARCKMIDIKIDETLNDAHEDLPNIERVVKDDDSPISTVVIYNNTGLSLTVYYSGYDNKKSVEIPAGRSSSITVKNGEYKIAASVPPSHIRPYAGKTTLAGGRYEIGFWIVTR